MILSKINILRIGLVWRIWFFITPLLCAAPLLQEEPKIIVPPQEIGTATFQSGETFSLAAWNIEWFPAQRSKDDFSKKTERRIGKISDFIQKINPTILFACEIRDLNSLKRLHLNYPFMACADFLSSSEKENQGLALMSKIAWKEIWLIDFSSLPKADDRPTRGILGAEFILPSGKILTIYGVHLKSNRSSIKEAILQRQRAMDYLEWDWKRRKLDPARDVIIVMGDFNTSLYDPVFSKETTIRRLIDQGFASAMKDAKKRATLKPSVENHYRGTDFDHIFLSRPLQRELSSRSPWGKIFRVTPDLSDHHLLWLPAPSW